MNRRLINRIMPLVAAASLVTMSVNTAQADLTDPNGYIAGVGASSYAVMNTSGASATVTAAYYNPGGSIATTQSLPTIPALGRANVDVATVPGLPANWAGSVVLSADQDIIAAAVTAYTGRNPVPDASAPPAGTEASVYEAFNAGATRLFAPSLFRIPGPPSDNVPARQVSRFTIQNTTGSTANYTITYRARDGFLLGTWTGSLNPYGSRTFQTRINSDLPAGFLTNLQGRGTGFSAQIDSDQPLAGVSESVTSIGTGSVLANWTGDHAMLTPAAAATVLFSPAAFRLCPNTPTAQANCAQYANINNHYTSFIQYSSFQLQNTSNVTANVTAEFINRATGLISYTLNFTIAPNSGYGINLFNGGSLPLTHPLFPALGSRFVGSVRFTSDQPLVGVGNLDFPQSTVAYYGSYNLIGASDATNTVLVPTFNRVCPNNDATCNINNLGNFTRVSAVQVMNVGTSTVTLNNFELIDANGNVVVTLTNANGGPLTLNPGQAIGLNLFNGGDFALSQFSAIGNNFQGSLRVNAPAGAKLKAIVEWRDGNRSMDQFNAFNR